MSHISNAVNMLIFIQNRGNVKVRELAEELELDERTIRRYKKDLETAGIYIGSKPGVKGGYYLENPNYLLGLHLSDGEYTSLLMIGRELRDGQHLALKDYKSVMEKLSLVYKIGGNESVELENYIVKSTRSNMQLEKERQKLIVFHGASLAHKKVCIEYISLTSGRTSRIVRPYAVFQYKGDMYLAGYCEIRCRIIDFKLLRVKEYRVLEEHYDRDESFNITEFMNSCFGIYQGAELDVKLHIFHPMSQIVSEKIWSRNQQITCNEDGSIFFEARIKGMEEIKSWVLGMGRSVKVLEPLELVEEIKRELEDVKNLYKIF